MSFHQHFKMYTLEFKHDSSQFLVNFTNKVLPSVVCIDRYSYMKYKSQVL